MPSAYTPMSPVINGRTPEEVIGNILVYFSAHPIIKQHAPSIMQNANALNTNLLFWNQNIMAPEATHNAVKVICAAVGLEQDLAQTLAHNPGDAGLEESFNTYFKALCTALQTMGVSAQAERYQMPIEVNSTSLPFDCFLQEVIIAGEAGISGERLGSLLQ